MMREWPMGGMRVLRLALLWIEKAPNECCESAAVDPVVDSDWCQDANGGSGGGGNPSTSRNGDHDRDTSRTPPPRGKQSKMEEEERL